MYRLKVTSTKNNSSSNGLSAAATIYFATQFTAATIWGWPLLNSAIEIFSKNLRKAGYVMIIILLPRRAEVKLQASLLTIALLWSGTYTVPFLLPMTSQVARPLCLRKCQTFLDSSHVIWPTICSPFTLTASKCCPTVPVMRLFTCYSNNCHGHYSSVVFISFSPSIGVVTRVATILEWCLVAERQYVQ